MMSTRTGVRALVMVTLCYGALEIVGLLLLLLLLFHKDRLHEGPLTFEQSSSYELL